MEKRTIAVVGPDGNGKTALVRSLLQCKKQKENPIEEKRNYTLSSKTLVSDIDNTSLHLIDTPGSLNYITDLVNAAKVSNGAVYVLDGVGGATPQGRRLWNTLVDAKIPTLVYVNMMDGTDANFAKALQTMETSFAVKPLPIAVPVGAGTGFKGIINLIEEKFYEYDGTSYKSSGSDLTNEHKDILERYKPKMIEAVVENDEDLMEKYFAGEKISNEKLREVLAKAVLGQSAFPVFVGSASTHVGTDLLRNALFYYTYGDDKKQNLEFTDNSRPEANPTKPFVGYVYKTQIDTYTGKTSYVKIISGTIDKTSKLVVGGSNSPVKFTKIYKPTPDALKQVEKLEAGDIAVLDKLDDLKTGETLIDASLHSKTLISYPEPKRVLSYAVDLDDRKLEEKIVIALKKIAEEDPGIEYKRIPETGELVVSGLGQLQFDVIKEKLKEEYKLEINYRLPRIQYRETITKSVEVQGRHKKQSGGHGQFADTKIKVKPMSRAGGFEFADEITGGSIPKNFIPSVEKGVQKAMEKGILAGYPVTDISVTLYDGSYHSVDSSDMAFQIAGSVGMKVALEQAGPILLEPVMNVKIYVSDDFVGAVTNDLSGRRGRITGMDSSPAGSVVRAQAPLAELLNYAPELHSMTKGLGVFEMEFSAYEPLPNQFVDKVITDTTKWREETETRA